MVTEQTIQTTGLQPLLPFAIRFVDDLDSRVITTWSRTMEELLDDARLKELGGSLETLKFICLCDFVVEMYPFSWQIRAITEEAENFAPDGIIIVQDGIIAATLRALQKKGFMIALGGVGA
jgi:hypothetical protein